MLVRAHISIPQQLLDGRLLNHRGSQVQILSARPKNCRSEVVFRDWRAASSSFWRAVRGSPDVDAQVGGFRCRLGGHRCGTQAFAVGRRRWRQQPRPQADRRLPVHRAKAPPDRRRMVRWRRRSTRSGTRTGPGTPTRCSSIRNADRASPSRSTVAAARSCWAARAEEPGPPDRDDQSQAQVSALTRWLTAVRQGAALCRRYLSSPRLKE